MSPGHSAAPAVFADANVLYASSPRDILIELAQADVIELHWSPAVLDELRRALVRTRPEYNDAKAAKLVEAMTAALPDAPVDPVGDLDIALPDAGDLHVLAAAHAASCDILLTFNLVDFPAEAIGRVDPPVAVSHPDAFMLKLLTTQAAAVLPVIDRVRRQLTRPPLSVPEYAGSLGRSGLPQTAELLRHLLPA